MTATRPAALATTERTATTKTDRGAIGDVVTSYKDAPTRTVSAGGVDFAYRELGPKTGVPVVFLTHLAAVLDNWDPRVVDGIAARHRVIAFDNRGVGASSGSTPNTIEAMANDAVAFIRALGLEKVDLFGFSMGGMIAQVIAADEPQLVRKLILAGTGPAGGVGITNVTRIAHLDTLRGLLTLQDPKQFLFFTRTPNGRRAGKEFLARLKERTDNRDKRISLGPTAPSSPPSTAGASSSLPTCRSFVSRFSSPTARATGWCRRATRSTWLSGCRTRSWWSTPTPATAASSSSTGRSSTKPSLSSPSSTTSAGLPSAYPLTSNDVPEPSLGRRLRLATPLRRATEHHETVTIRDTAMTRRNHP